MPSVALSPINRIILGSWGLSGECTLQGKASGYGKIASEVVEAILDSAWELGIRWIDTAPSYGAGRGYRRIARWQSSRGVTFHYIVKPGRPIVRGVPASVLSESSIIEEINEACETLGPPSAILIKDPPIAALTNGQLDDRLAFLEERFPHTPCGVASHELSACKELKAVSRTRITLIEYNGVNFRSAAPLADTLTKRGLLVWAMQPLSYGFLGNRYRQVDGFGEDDFRHRIPLEVRMVMSVAAREFLRRLDDCALKVSDATLAIAFCLSDSNLSRVVIGPRSVFQLRTAVEALGISRNIAFIRVARTIREPICS